MLLAARREMPIRAVPLVASHLTGVAALRELGHTALEQTASGETTDLAPDLAISPQDGLDDLVRQLAARGHGVVMLMGKGGVGKTTLASAVAVALARQGYPVHLSTTDPAAHLAHAVGPVLPAGLTLSRIDPAVETARYTEEVLKSSGLLDDEERALLEEDLRLPLYRRNRRLSRLCADGAGGRSGLCHSRYGANRTYPAAA